MLDGRMTYRPILVLLHPSSADHDLCLLDRVRDHFGRRGGCSGCYSGRHRLLPPQPAAVLDLDPLYGGNPTMDPVETAASAAALSSAVAAAVAAAIAAAIAAAVAAAVAGD